MSLWDNFFHVYKNERKNRGLNNFLKYSSIKTNKMIMTKSYYQRTEDVIICFAQ